MDIYQRIESFLEELGLTQYESQVFIALFKKSPQFARDISKSSGVSRGRIYDILKTLNHKGLVIEKTRKGTPNIYELITYPQCIKKLQENRLKELEGKIDRTKTIIIELKTYLGEIDREKPEEHDLTKDDPFSIVKGQASIDYYVKKFLSEAEQSVTTNFTADYIKRYEEEFVSVKEKNLAMTFVLPETEFPQIKDITKGTKRFIIGLKDLNLKIMKVFKDVRPLILMIDEKKGITIFQMDPINALIAKTEFFIQYQKHILSLFIEGSIKLD
ncbi:TrmB family transcriptional regulator [Candidatus Heimdallarchaeota archaeon]|nr:MAG: TrmB family transcriptional regulator [Candidatus Heimdallarchaeota archaeon]